MSSTALEAIQCTLPRCVPSLLPSTGIIFPLLKCPHDGKLTTSQGSPLTLGQPLLLGAWNLPHHCPHP